MNIQNIYLNICPEYLYEYLSEYLSVHLSECLSEGGQDKYINVERKHK